MRCKTRNLLGITASHAPAPTTTARYAVLDAIATAWPLEQCPESGPPPLPWPTFGKPCLQTKPCLQISNVPCWPLATARHPTPLHLPALRSRLQYHPGQQLEPPIHACLSLFGCCWHVYTIVI